MGVEQVRAIVKRVSEEKYGHNLVVDAGDLGTVRRPGTNFVLRVRLSKGPGARRSGSGRRTVAACWHAHRDVMMDIFAAAPDARLTSALADYRGAADFAASFPATGHHNVGSMMEPAAIANCCECAEDVVDEPPAFYRSRFNISIPADVSAPGADSMRWTPEDAEDEIAEWAKILNRK